MDTIKNILVAVDFSPCSCDALRQAARIAAWNGASVTALYVVDMAAFCAIPDPLLTAGVTVPPMEILTAAARERWSKFACDCPGRASVRFEVEVGSPRDRILEKTYHSKPDLLLIGAHSEADKGRVIGATASACVQRAAAKVIVVREGQAGKFKSVVVCVDFSDASRVALEQAVRIAAQDDAVLHVLHAYSDPWHGLDKPQEVQDVMPDFPERFERAVEDRLRAFCEPLAHEILALKAKFHARLSPNHGEAIIAFVKTVGCDLVVLGTRGKWSLRDFFWGSTAERVVRDCPCSVFAIKPPGYQQMEPYQPLRDTQTVHVKETHRTAAQPQTRGA